jgi:2Fe-2S ferredoxin
MHNWCFAAGCRAFICEIVQKTQYDQKEYSDHMNEKMGGRPVPVVVYVLPGGERREIKADEGSSVMETALGNLVPGILGECGGQMSCATCHVYVDDGFIDRLPPADDMENDLLDGVASERQPGSRLSCQITMTAELDGITVRVPESQI